MTAMSAKGRCICPLARAEKGDFYQELDHEVTSASICSLLERPTRRFASRPSLNRIRVGIPRMLKRGVTDGLSSTLTLYTLASPASFWAAASTAGDMARHGPHQGAQKSTRTGSLDW